MWYCQQQDCRLWDSLATRPIQTSSVHIGPHADFRPGFAAESDSEMAPQLIENARSGLGNGSRPLPYSQQGAIAFPLLDLRGHGLKLAPSGALPFPLRGRLSRRLRGLQRSVGFGAALGLHQCGVILDRLIGIGHGE
jgi:hypothetical protein